ncbi:hypothetical protein [Arenimonas sp.]|uniref:hypothetical protein n=1 Tax=Arenimonas sp. TaxID=1872635 RepID=UPI002E381F9F|nr:hypothetical protein [Arenimonas sp.]HEX4854834.1 hypothetical protein [Arenimonas sp.]
MSDDNGAWLLALGAFGAASLYWTIYRYCRNTDKSHAFERKNAVDAKPVPGSNGKVSAVTGRRESRTSGGKVRRVVNVRSTPNYYGRLGRRD